MKLFGTFRFSLLTAILLFGAMSLPGGHPLPPHRLPPAQRQANMLMLRFQDALAAEHWQEALDYCSPRVHSKAAEWPTPKEFFQNTMPIEHVLAQTWGCWSCGTNFYGMFVTLSDYDVTPRLDWYWGLAATAGGYQVDYPPVKLDEYDVKKKAALQAREDRLQEIHRSLEPKVQGVATRLTAVSDRFVVGSPMLFRIEITNSGPTSVHYLDSGVRYAALMVQNEKKERMQHGGFMGQIGVGHAELKASASAVLADKFDLNEHRSITKPGMYLVQFDGRDLAIGRPDPSYAFPRGHFGENDLVPASIFGMFTATNKFPSNTIEIEVQP